MPPSSVENEALNNPKGMKIPRTAATVHVGGDRDLLTDLAKLRKAGHGWRAVHLLTSPLASRKHFASDLIAANEIIMAVLVTGAGYKVYNLTNGDIVFTYSQVATPAIVALCTSLETTIFDGVTPVKNIYGEYGHYKLFDLVRDMPKLIEGVRTVLSAEPAINQIKPPIGPKHAVLISEKLRGSNIRALVFNQPIYNITHPKPSIEFLEFYTSIAELEKSFAPDRSIAANPWLFNLIKRELDVALMRSINREITEYRHKAFSLNLLVDSFMSDGFRAFLGTLPVKMGGRVYAELERADLVQHSHLLLDLLERGRQLDVPICIDGLSHHDIHLMRLADLRFPFIKLKWDQDITTAPPGDVAMLVQELKSANSRIILTRCDTPKAISFARAMGINYVQGRLADEFFRSGETLDL